MKSSFLKWRSLFRFAVVWGIVLSVPSIVFAQASATATALSVYGVDANGNSVTNPTSVAEGTMVTLTATVTQNSGGPAFPGAVSFCTEDPGAPGNACSDIHLLGTAQLVQSAGGATASATIRLRPGVGSYQYWAKFLGTSTNSSSSSPSPQSLLVAQGKTTVTLSQSGTSGNYVLSATVSRTGSGGAPTGDVSFLDASNNNFSLGQTGSLVSPPGAVQPVLGTLEPTLLSDGPNALATGDFNEDGIPDVAILHSPMALGAPLRVDIYLGQPGGGFIPASTSPISIASGAAGFLQVGTSIIAGDFDNDGHLDLALTSSLNSVGHVYWLRNTGDQTGNFNLPSEITPPAGNFGALGGIAAADFNGDGNLDLAIVDGTKQTLWFYQGNGMPSNTFGTVPAWQVATPNGAFGIVAGDFNNDGRPDVAFTTSNASNKSISVYLNTSTATSPWSFDGGTTYNTGINSGPYAIYTADLNHDGNLDLIVPVRTEPTINSLVVYWGNSAGNFSSPPLILPVGGRASSVAVGDFNLDGIADLAVIQADSINPSVKILLGIEGGQFDTNNPLGPVFLNYSNVNTISIVASDFDGDGIPELVVANRTGNNLSMIPVSLIHTATASSQSNIAVVGNGDHSVVAEYHGDTNYATAISASSVSLSAQKINTSLTLVADPANNSSQGDLVNLVVTVSASGNSQGHVPTGWVKFYSDGNPASIGQAALADDGNGHEIATWPTTSLQQGMHSLTAVYQGDSNFNASDDTSSPYSYTVGPPDTSTPKTTTTLMLNAPSGGSAGQPVTLTATVSPDTDGQGHSADGTKVYFSNNNALIVDCQQGVVLQNGTAQCTTTFDQADTYNLSATYGGNAYFTSSIGTLQYPVNGGTQQDFTLASSDAGTQTIASGGAASFTFSLQPTSGTYPGSVSFAVSGLPEGASYTITPNQVSSNAGPQTITLNVQTTAATAAVTEKTQPGAQRGGMAATSMALFILPLAGLGCLRKHNKSLQHFMARLLLIGVGVAATMTLSGCGSKHITVISTGGTTASYAIVVTATANKVPHQAYVTLVVKQ